ncbi:hypothetical protein BHM03_00056948 [Ensete ventricosum]|nr:hypothetical protein BHM03_00056948 [Ensete ventricosum]
MCRFLLAAWLSSGKVHGSLARAGKVRGQTPKQAKTDKPKNARGRAYKRMQYNRRFVTAGTSESHGGDLIIQMYDRSNWRVGLLQCSHSLKGARQVRGQS